MFYIYFVDSDIYYEKSFETVEKAVKQAEYLGKTYKILEKHETGVMLYNYVFGPKRNRFIYILRIFEYNSFSYDGIKENDLFVHATKEGAEKHAEEMGLVIKSICKDPDKEATLEEIQILD